jgi:two-component SAPR family response regulator
VEALYVGAALDNVGCLCHNARSMGQSRHSQTSTKPRRAEESVVWALVRGGGERAMQSTMCTAKALGVPRVSVALRRITRKDWGSKRALELFFLLLNHPDGLSKECIGERLFADDDEVGRDGLFHSTLYRCRQAVGKSTVVWEDDVYRIGDVSSWSYDVAEFEALVAQAGQSDREDHAQGLYEAALDLYEGDYLEGYQSEWCEPTRERLRRLFLRAVLALAQIHARRGRSEKALDLYRLAVSKDYYCEEAHRGIVDSLLALGDRLAAMRHYLDLVERLEEDVPLTERGEIPELVEDILGVSLRDLMRERRGLQHRSVESGARFLQRTS